MDAKNATSAGFRAPVVALATDLIFAARIRGTAAQVGASVVIVRNTEELSSIARAEKPRLILVDLDARTGDPIGAIRAIKADPTLASATVVGFVSHVRESLIDEARRAGADRVLARSAFVRDLARLLATGE